MRKTSYIITAVTLAILYCFASVEVNSFKEAAFMVVIAGAMTGISVYMLIKTKNE